MGRMLGAHDSSELDRPDLNKCPDCRCFFAGDNRFVDVVDIVQTLDLFDVFLICKQRIQLFVVNHNYISFISNHIFL